MPLPYLVRQYMAHSSWADPTRGPPDHLLLKHFLVLRRELVQNDEATGFRNSNPTPPIQTTVQDDRTALDSETNGNPSLALCSVYLFYFTFNLFYFT